MFLLEISSYNLNKLKMRKKTFEDKLSEKEITKIGKNNKIFKCKYLTHLWIFFWINIKIL